MSIDTGWRDPSKYIKKIHVEETCLELPYTQEILQRCGLPYSIVPERMEPEGIDEEYPQNLTEGKKHLYLCINRGTFFKPCPATQEYQCCDYQVLNTGMNCPIDCSYCILQAYLNKPWISCFVNIDQMFDEMRLAFKGEPERYFRIGTGEFTDSLALDRLTGLSKKIVPFIADKDHAILELKTKSAFIDNLKSLDHGGRTLVAWSLNSQKVMQHEEIRAASLEERFEAAVKCSSWGYRLAFHFDPIIHYPGWQEGYSKTIDLLFKRVPAESISYISLGGFRYLPSLKKIGSTRFKGSRIYSEEFIEGLDGKARYFRTQRVELYHHLVYELKKRAADNTCIYFCMESDEIWEEIMGYSPEEKGGLHAMLDRAVF
jgi:spore photoproduct lyase